MSEQGNTYRGYVRVDRGEAGAAYYVQIPDDNPWGFSLCDEEEGWPGGLGNPDGATWGPASASEVPEEVRERLGWILDDYTMGSTPETGEGEAR